MIGTSIKNVIKHINVRFRHYIAGENVPVSVSELLKVPIVLAFDFAQNGECIVYSSNRTRIPQLYFLSTEPGSKPRQITYGKDPVIFSSIFPSGKNLVYAQDKDGNEIQHLFVLPVEGGKSRQITRKAYNTMALDVSPDEKQITRSFATKKSCGLETINPDTGECFILKEPTPPLAEIKYSHDGKWVATTSYENPQYTRIIVINADDPSDIVPYSVDKKSREASPSWSPDDKKLAFTNTASGRNQIVIQEFQGKDRVFLGTDKDAEATSGAVWSPRSDKVYYTVSRHTQSSIHGHPIDGEIEPALPFPAGTVDQAMPRISKDGRVVVVLHSSMTSPFGIYSCTVGSSSSTRLTPLTFKADLAELVRPEAVWYKSFDGRRIHAWYMPAATGTGRRPAVVYVHGGPWAQVSDNWFDGLFMQSLSQNGFACFAPNFRGSSGFGAEFQDLDMGDPGGGDLEDVTRGAEWLRKQPNVQESKIAIIGGSYGGYMTLIALTKKPDVFAAGVALVPVVDWLKMHQLSDPAYRAFIEALFRGSPSEKKNLYHDRSPASFVSDISAPVMIMAGKNDYRCPIQPIGDFVEKLKTMKHPYEFMLEEKAGHQSALMNQEESIPIFNNFVNYIKRVLC